jgi:hypothetical protein
MRELEGLGEIRVTRWPRRVWAGKSPARVRIAVERNRV